MPEVTVSPVAAPPDDRSAAPEVADSAVPLSPARPAHAPRGPFYALTFRNFRLFFYGQLVSVIGTWMQQVAQNWVVWDLTHDPRWLGVVSAANAVPYVLFSVWGGQIADRYSKRWILIWMQTLQMVTAFGLAFLAWGIWIKMQAWHIVLFSALLGLISAINMPAQQSFVVELVDSRDALSNAIALSALRFNLARVIGPLIAGIVLLKLGATMCFALNGLSFVAVIVSLVMMNEKPMERATHDPHVLEGFRYIVRSRRVLRIVLLIGAASLFAWSASTLFPMLSDHFHRGQRGFTMIMVFHGVGAAVGAATLAAFGEVLSRRMQVYGGAFLFAVALCALAACAGSFYLALALLALSGFAMIIFGMASQTLVQEEVPDTLRGRVMAVYSLVFQGLLPIGGLEIGFLANRIQALPSISINAAVFLLAVSAVYYWSRRSPSGPIVPASQ